MTARIGLATLSLITVLALAFVAHWLTVTGRTLLGRELLEYPLWAVAVGLLANGFLRWGRWHARLSGTWRTEFFLKTGLVLLGSTVNVRDVVSFGSRGLVQAALLVTGVFFFTWFVAGLFRLEPKLKALMAAAVSICGVSAAIAAAGSVLAKKEHLTYVATLVIAFALPLMLLQPLLAKALGLPTAVAGAWIGGNIDTTAAVVGAGAMHSEAAMKVASVVKMAQNALIGVAAFLLALYWALRDGQEDKGVGARVLWDRFPKFVLGFIAASAFTTLLAGSGVITPAQIKVLTALRNWFLTLAFVSMGLEISPRGLLALGARPVAVYALATAFNMGLALVVAWLVFGSLGR